MDIMEWVKVTTHMAPMAVQAGLLHLEWRRPEYRESALLRWTRMSLLPITLSFVLADLWNLKYHSNLSILTKTNMGCTWGGHFFRTFLLAFQNPSSSQTQPPQVSPDVQKPATSKTLPDTEQSPIPFPVNIFLLAFAGSTDPSKQHKMLSRPGQDIRADMRFFWATVGRIIFLQMMGITALLSWKMTNDARMVVVDQPMLNLLKTFKSEIRAFCFGVFVWIGIDLSGCIPRVCMFGLKMVSRLMARMTADPALSKTLHRFNQLDLAQTIPFYYQRLPLEASSITDFWSRHWHEVLKDLFIEAGVVPVTFLLVNFLRLNPKSKIVRISGMMGAFAVSAVLHEVGLWVAAPLDPTFKTSVFFLSQGVGASLENGYKKIVGRKVNGFLGRLWLLTWLVYFGQPMVSMWVNNLGLDEQEIFRKVDDTSFYRFIFSPPLNAA